MKESVESAERERLSVFALHSAPGMGSAMLRRLVRAYGRPSRVIEEATPIALAQIPRMTSAMIAAILALPGRLPALQQRLKRLEAEGYALLHEWAGEPMPERLQLPPHPPALAYLRGRLPAGPYCAVVGTTKPSAAGRDLARALAAGLARAGWTVVSGYAPGVDTAAHAGALEAGGSTVMFPPIGVERFARRPELAAFEAEWGRRAVVVSELFPDRDWSAAHAMARNRLVAGVSDALVVVEARADGGSIATFRMARRAGVPTFAVQWDALPSGNAQALAEGATPVRGTEDLPQIVAARPRRTEDGFGALWDGLSGGEASEAAPGIGS